jgi:hypothetical protein
MTNRVRLLLDDSIPLPSLDEPRRRLFPIPSGSSSVADLLHLIRRKFDLTTNTNNELQLYVDDFYIEPTAALSILKEQDIVRYILRIESGCVLLTTFRFVITY